MQQPNKLRILIKGAGLTLQEISREVGIPEGVLRHWIAGDVVIPEKERALLARVLGCSMQDLAPNHLVSQLHGGYAICPLWLAGSG